MTEIGGQLCSLNMGTTEVSHGRYRCINCGSVTFAFLSVVWSVCGCVS